MNRSPFDWGRKLSSAVVTAGDSSFSLLNKFVQVTPSAASSTTLSNGVPSDACPSC
jgi:hypothetical protein